MRILLVPNSYSPVLGGLQTVTHTLARHLIDQGHEIRVITNRYPRTLPPIETLDHVPLRRWLFLQPSKAQIRKKRLDLFLASIFYYPDTLLRFQRLMSRYQPDVVNVHFPDAQTPYILWLRRRFRFRLAVSLHGDEIERWQTPPASGNFRQLKTILLEADAVTACSRYLLDQAVKLVPAIKQKGTVIHNGIDPTRFQNRTPYPHPRPYVLAYGRLTHKKGFDLLLEAWATTTARDQIDLLIAGDGEEKESLISKTQKLGLAGNIHFVGRASSDQVVQLLNGCRFVVVPSRQEPFGIVALEAMAARKPLLATAVGGLVELLEPTSACLVQPTVEGIKQGLETLLADPAPYSKYGNILAQHQWNRILPKYESILAA